MGKFLYMDIKEYILKIIRENKDKTNYKLPSENQLAMRFSTTRITAKRALAELQEEGYLYRIHGKGTFISPTISDNEELQTGTFVCFFLPNLSSHFMTDMIIGMRNELIKNGIHLLVVSGANDSQKINRLYIRQYLNLGIKGFIVFPYHPARFDPDLISLALKKFPVIFVDRTLRDFDVSSITSDHFNMAKKAAEFLFERGCRKIGFITRPPEYSTSIFQRLNGFEQAHIERSYPILRKRILYLEKEYEDRSDLIQQFIHENPDMDGLLTYGGVIGENVYRAIAKEGIDVPEQLQIVFLDDELAAISDLLPFSPTCIKQNSVKIGQEAARLMRKYLETGKVTTDKIIVDTEIIVRDSTK